MADPALATKLLRRPGVGALVLEPPAGYTQRIVLADGVERVPEGEEVGR
jgi:hypothetical protein